VIVPVQEQSPGALFLERIGFDLLLR